RFGAEFRGLARSSTPDIVRRYIERDRHFHSRLVELAENPHLMAALDSVNMMFFAYQDGLVRAPAETVPEHLAILEALGRRDSDAAETAMRLHLRRSIERLEAEADAEETRAATSPEGGPTGRRPHRRAASGSRGSIARQHDRRETS
ncbi:MAG: FCD domain-containing protein, partial [Zetaproteobacteria bacterium]